MYNVAKLVACFLLWQIATSAHAQRIDLFNSVTDCFRGQSSARVSDIAIWDKDFDLNSPIASSVIRELTTMLPRNSHVRQLSVFNAGNERRVNMADDLARAERIEWRSFFENADLSVRIEKISATEAYRNWKIQIAAPIEKEQFIPCLGRIEFCEDGDRFAATCDELQQCSDTQTCLILEQTGHSDDASDDAITVEFKARCLEDECRNRPSHLFCGLELIGLKIGSTDYEDVFLPLFPSSHRGGKVKPRASRDSDVPDGGLVLFPFPASGWDEALTLRREIFDQADLTCILFARSTASKSIQDLWSHASSYSETIALPEFGLFADAVRRKIKKYPNGVVRNAAQETTLFVPLKYGRALMDQIQKEWPNQVLGSATLALN